MNKRELIERARRDHDCGRGATEAELAAAESVLGHRFPDDLRELLSELNGARFWSEHDYPCRFLPLDEIKPVRRLFDVPDGPHGLLAVIEASGDYVAVDVDSASPSYGRMIDCFHETFPFELHGVCDSAWELLSLVLRSAGAEWLWPAAVRYGVDFAVPTAPGG
ncbi:SMI1/KNR4 family protein [Myxococcota bacterium]|nr:SMI1/KNR4 family protein [Myxococcota bacterium]